MDPESDRDPAIFLIGLQDANKILILFKKFFCILFLKVHLQNFSKIKSQKEVTKTVESKVFLTTYFWLLLKKDPDPDPYL